MEKVSVIGTKKSEYYKIPIRSEMKNDYRNTPT